MTTAALVSSGASLLCRLLGPSTNALFVRCPCVRAKGFSSVSNGPPKAPLSGYLRFVNQQRKVVSKLYPDFKPVEITKMIAKQWLALTSEQRLPFEEATRVEREKYQEELKRFHASLTLEQSLALLETQRQKREKKKTKRMKRELTVLGKPKRPRTAFNIFMSEHFLESRGVTMTGKMKALVDDWAKLDPSLKRTYIQLAADDKARYAQEIAVWEGYMVEIGRGDLLRRKATLRKLEAREAKDRAAAAPSTDGTGTPNPAGPTSGPTRPEE